MSVRSKILHSVGNSVFRYIYKNPQKNMLRLVKIGKKFAGKMYPESTFTMPIDIISNENNIWHQYLFNGINDVDKDFLRKAALTFAIDLGLIGTSTLRRKRDELHCNIPWVVLLDPTSACNLKCKGCWAAEYGSRLNLSFDEIDSIITQGKELGVYIYIYTGGEPLVRRDDLVALCRKHSDCQFLCFTNATLIDEGFADAMLSVKNFIPAISVEGFESATDSRRGAGTYRKVVDAMALLKRKKLPFGISSCYTSQNFESISSDEYFDQMVEWGASFVWYFHYMPVGNAAVPELLPTPEQREYMYRRIRAARREKPIFAMDFQNDGEFVQGCIAGGRRYFHINANGDCDPCVFIHYSNANIRDMSLLDVLRSPIFMAYHDGQPFNGNHLMPCPMLENPHKLQEMVEKSGAHSTDLESPESAEHLCEKCSEYARNWAPAAERLWQCSCREKLERQAENNAESYSAAV